jgi:type VI secretion system protein ImpL
MIDFIRQRLGLIMMVMGGLIMLVFLAYTFFSDDEEDEDEDEEGYEGRTKSPGANATTLEIGEGELRKSRMIALKDSLERSLQTRAGVKEAGGIDRLAMPWFMLVGTENSGKRSLLANTGLPLPYGPPVEVDSSRKDAGRWWLFEEAVVVEAPTVKASPRPMTPQDSTVATAALGVDVSEGWNNLLGLLRRERPDSPLNGIVVTLSAADLVGSRRKNPEELAEQADLIKTFLDRTRRVLGVRLPVHILVNRCDVIPGFRSFAESMPEGRRDDVFGWSNPRPLEKPFETEWVEDGFAELKRNLESVHDDLLAGLEVVPDADGLFVFINEFGDLQDPLADFIDKIMPKGERRPSLFLRGIYFTGDPSERAARAAAIDSDEDATLHISMEASEAEAHSLVFLRRLFVEKIFQEAGLARTASRIKVSRDLRVLGAQAAAMMIALLGGAGLWASLYGFQADGDRYGAALTTQAADLSRLMSGVAIDLDQFHRESSPDTALEHRLQDAAVINLVTEMRNITSSRMRSAFVPSSWLSPLPKKIHGTVLQGIQSVVLPVAQQRLQAKIADLLGTNGHGAVDELDPSDPTSLATYLGEVRTLNLNIARYNALASADSGNVADLGALVDYLFGQRLTTDTAAVSDEFEAALREATAPRLEVTPAQNNGVLLRAVGLVNAIADSATRQLTGRGSARPEDDLRALRRVRDLINLTDPRTGLAATVRDATPAGRNMARSLQDSIARRIEVVGTRVLRDTLLPDQASQRIRSVLGGLFAMRLLEPVRDRQIDQALRPGMTLRWDIGQLELGLALRGELTRARIAAADAFPAATATRLRTAFDTQMRSRLIDLVAQAQRFTPDTLSALTEIRATTANIEAARDRLVKLNALMDTLKSSSEGRKLYAMGARQSERVLALAQHLLDSVNYFAPHPASVAAWRGGYPIGFAALGVSDTGAFNLRLEQEQISPVVALAASVAPALDFLRQPFVTPAMIASPRLVADWRAIVANADPTLPNSSLASLVVYLRTTMGPIDPPSCRAASLQKDAGSTANDWFSIRRRQMRAAMLGRCHPGGSGDAVAAYDRLRALFQAKLAGKFPFVDTSKAASAPDADPAAVREFYQAYDAFARSGDVMLRSDPRVAGAAKAAVTFLDQMAAARPFFAAFVDSGATRKAPEFAFVAEPIGAGQTAELHTGTRVTLLNDSTQAGVWGFGEPVRVTAAGDTATSFRSTGWWGLVELAELQSKIRVRFYQPDTKVRLELPVFPTSAPLIPVRR